MFHVKHRTALCFDSFVPFVFLVPDWISVKSATQVCTPPVGLYYDTCHNVFLFKLGHTLPTPYPLQLVESIEPPHSIAAPKDMEDNHPVTGDAQRTATDRSGPAQDVLDSATHGHYLLMGICCNPKSHVCHHPSLVWSPFLLPALPA